MNKVIIVKDLEKEFKVYNHKNGFLNSVKELFNREYEMKKAVNKINFEIEEGEIVGYLGPNGAGKSTTIKMLSGVLVPSSGLVEVAGLNPHLDRIKNAKNIGVVFGQRSQLIWDVPVIDSFMALELGEGSLKDVKGKFYGAKVFEEYTKDQVEEYNKKFPYIPKMRFPGQWE